MRWPWNRRRRSLTVSFVPAERIDSERDQLRRAVMQKAVEVGHPVRGYRLDDGSIHFEIAWDTDPITISDE